MSKTGKKRLGFLIIAAVSALSVWIAWDNARIVLTEIKVESERLPESFDGYRIAHISDLHNDEFGERNERLIALLKAAEPDMIAVTGDLLDSRRQNLKKALNFVQQAMKIAPCYYVTGNHESRAEGYKELEKEMEKAGVVLLRDKTVMLEKGGARIRLIGVDDPRFKIQSNKKSEIEALMTGVLEGLLEESEKEEFKLLLSHRPELFEVYCAQGVDLALTGHVHGGQFRLPFIGGLVGAPHMFFPEYDAGLYTEGSTNMVVSRGLGQSIIPFRINNPPEVVLIEFVSE